VNRSSQAECSVGAAVAGAGVAGAGVAGAGVAGPVVGTGTVPHTPAILGAATPGITIRTPAQHVSRQTMSAYDLIHQASIGFI